MSSLPENKHMRNIVIAFYILIFSAAVYFFAQYLLPYLLPFLLAYLVAVLVEPLVAFLNKKAHIPRVVSSVISVFGSVAVISTLLIAIINRIIGELKGISALLPDMAENIDRFFTTAKDSIDMMLSYLPIRVTNYLGDVLSVDFSDGFRVPTSLTSGIMDAVTSFAAKIPHSVVFIVIFLVAAVFISIDLRRINGFLLSLMSPHARSMVLDAKQHMLKTVAQFLKAYLILFCITTVELLIGLSLIGVKYALVLAMLIALIDILPILGTGTVLIPWGLFCLLQGEYARGLSLLLLYAVILFIRQILEPKIVGQNIGLHPVATLMAIYFGINIIGFMGIFIGPFIVIFVKFLFEKGYLHWFRWNEDKSVEKNGSRSEPPCGADSD